MKHLPIALFASLAAVCVPAAAANCEGLATLALPNTTISTAASVVAGDFTPPEGGGLKGMPAFCRVAGVIKPAADSNIQFEVWMPASGWNGKFQGIGNGGYAGSIGYGAMAAAVRHSYATASTDTGHHGGPTDSAWALDHPDKIADFGYRAIHETADKAKTIIKAYYGESARHSYFSSCSNGGRQALMEAQRYPNDYDGIIAGAPANYWTHLLAAALWDMQATMVDPASYIPAAKLPAIENAALEACDARDGVKDGVIDDPSTCHFDPSVLLCKEADSNSCLTAPQVEALKKIYGGVKTSKGEQLLVGFSPGGETGGGGWAAWITGAAPGKSLQYAFGNGFFSNMLYFKPDWDFHTYSPDKDPKIADQKMAKIFNATDTDLKAFKKHGGKLILYHGWSDAAIPPMNTVEYYQGVVAKMGAKDSAEFVRLFMVPGMQHCGGGPGPSDFGAGVITGGSPDDDIQAALEQWVESAKAPERLVAKKHKTMSPASEVVRSRPLCAYPMVEHWKGQGSTDDAANFDCVKPAK